jgi:hypothetical protein
MEENPEPERGRACPVDEGHQLPHYGVHRAIALSSQVDVHAHLAVLGPEGYDLHRNKVKLPGGQPHVGLIKEEDPIMHVQKLRIITNLVD